MNLLVLCYNIVNLPCLCKYYITPAKQIKYCNTGIKRQGSENISPIISCWDQSLREQCAMQQITSLWIMPLRSRAYRQYAVNVRPSQKSLQLIISSWSSVPPALQGSWRFDLVYDCQDNCIMHCIACEIKSDTVLVLWLQDSRYRSVHICMLTKYVTGMVRFKRTRNGLNCVNSTYFTLWWFN